MTHGVRHCLANVRFKPQLSTWKAGNKLAESLLLPVASFDLLELPSIYVVFLYKIIDLLGEIAYDSPKMGGQLLILAAY